MADKVLTVSIAAYNVEAFIEKALNSLLLPQPYMEKLEVIVVDDGSRDHTAAIIQPYVERFPDSIRLVSKENGGYGSTINTSLAQAKGQYYKLLDGDDWYCTEALCGLLDYLEHAEADLILSPYVEVTAVEKTVDRHPLLLEKAIDLEQAEMTCNTIVMHELVIRTECLRQQNLPITEHCFYTDSEFVFLCLTGAHTVSRYGDAVYCYRLGLEGQSVSLSGTRKHYLELAKVADKLYSIYEGKKLLVTGQHRKLMECMIDNITHNSYKAYLLLENPAPKKQELMQRDRQIRQKHPDVYRISMASKTVKLLRATHFVAYGLLCRLVLKQFSH